MGKEGFVDGLWIVDKWLGISGGASAGLFAVNVWVGWEGERGDELDVEDFWEEMDADEMWLLPSDLEDDDPGREEVLDLPLVIDFGEAGGSCRLGADTLGVSE